VAKNQVFVQALAMAAALAIRDSRASHQTGGPMRSFLAPVVAAAALLAAACSQSPSAPSSLSPGAGGTLFSGASDAQAPHEVPFKGRLDGTVVVTPVNPPFFNVVITASGEATYLGRFSLTVPHLVNFATAEGEGDFTFTAANGDMLTAHFTGTADTSTPVFAIDEHATITGGTGRFAGASGSFDAHRHYDPVAQTTTGTIEGTIVMH
jgi:hypothetical protein